MGQRSRPWLQLTTGSGGGPSNEGAKTTQLNCKYSRGLTVHIPNIAIVSYTSNAIQDDMGNCLGPYSDLGPRGKRCSDRARTPQSCLDPTRTQNSRPKHLNTAQKAIVTITVII